MVSYRPWNSRGVWHWTQSKEKGWWDPILGERVAKESFLDFIPEGDRNCNRRGSPSLSQRCRVSTALASTNSHANGECQSRHWPSCRLRRYSLVRRKSWGHISAASREAFAARVLYSVSQAFEHSFECISLPRQCTTTLMVRVTSSSNTPSAVLRKAAWASTRGFHWRMGKLNDVQYRSRFERMGRYHTSSS